MNITHLSSLCIESVPAFRVMGNHAGSDHETVTRIMHHRTVTRILRLGAVKNASHTDIGRLLDRDILVCDRHPVSDLQSDDGRWGRVLIILSRLNVHVLGAEACSIPRHEKPIPPNNMILRV